MPNDFPLSSDSTEANRSTFFSRMLARLTRYLPLCSGVVVFHGPSNALRAASTAMSTSFSVASLTEQMTSSVDGLMVSKVLPSTPLTHSLLMNLEKLAYCVLYVCETACEARPSSTYSPVGCWYLIANNVSCSSARLPRTGGGGGGSVWRMYLLAKRWRGQLNCGHNV